MKTQETQIKLFEPEVPAMRTAVRELATRLIERFADSGQQSDTDPAAVVSSFEQYLDILQNPQGATTVTTASPSNPMQHLGDYGIGLVNDLMRWANEFDLEHEHQALQMMIIPVTLLAIRQGVQLRDLQQVVDALSVLANETHHPAQLAELAEVMEEVINAAAPEIKLEQDRSDPQRPWRLLNLNHAIVATRTHDPQVMEQAFQQLMYRLPDDAPGFFAEGMEQMDIVGYPEHVRQLMEKYYELSHNPTLH